MKGKFKHSLSRKLIASILAVSSVVTLFITIIQLTFDFKQDVNVIEHNLELIRTSHLSAINRSVWDMDDNQIKIQLAGLTSIPSVEYAEIVGPNRNVIALLGEIADEETYLRKEYKLEYQNDQQLVDLGVLKVAASLDQVYANIYAKMFVIFFSQLLKTLLVSYFIYLVIQRLVIGNLVQVTKYVGQFDFRNSHEGLHLQRRENKAEESDEFDGLVASINDMRTNLIRSYQELTRLNRNLEETVDQKMGIILEQRKKLEISAKLTALGEMAGGIAHEINTPLAIIQLRAEQLEDMVSDGKVDIGLAGEISRAIGNTTKRIAKIILGLKFISREGSCDPVEMQSVSAIVEDTFSFCRERFVSRGVTLSQVMKPLSERPIEAECRAVEISQTLLNLLNNAFDAVEQLKDRWIRVDVVEHADVVEISVTDSGHGIPKEIRSKIMQPFFTTKEIGKGTGIGLSVSRGIMEAHQGTISIDESSPNTRFVMKLPKRQSVSASSAA